MHKGRRGRLSLLCLWWSAGGGALWHQEGGRPVGGMDPQKHSIGCLHGASKFVMGTGSLWDFGWGMGEGDGTGERLSSLPSCALSSRAQQLSLPLSSSLPTLRAELLTYNIPDVKSHWLSELMQYGPSAFARQTQGFRLARRSALPQLQLPPSSPCSMHRLSALPNLFRWPLVHGWLWRVLFC